MKMFYALLSGSMLIAVIGLLPPRSEAQGLQTCGQGVVIGPDQSVLLYPWTTFTAPLQPANPTLAPTFPASAPAPTKFTLTRGLPDALPLIVEWPDGSSDLVTLAAVRKLAKR